MSKFDFRIATYSTTFYVLNNFSLRFYPVDCSSQKVVDRTTPSWSNSWTINLSELSFRYRFGENFMWYLYVMRYITASYEIGIHLNKIVSAIDNLYHLNIRLLIWNIFFSYPPSIIADVYLKRYTKSRVWILTFYSYSLAIFLKNKK